VIDAPSPARADQFAAKLLAELRRDPGLYRSILLQGEGEFFERNGLLYLPLAGLEQLSDRLAAAQPLLGLLKARFDGAAVLGRRDAHARTAARRRRDRRGAALAPFYARRRALTLGRRARGRARPLSWNALLASGPEPSSRRLVVLQTGTRTSRECKPATERLPGFARSSRALNAAEPAP
jgi:hypothetical protein